MPFTKEQKREYYRLQRVEKRQRREEKKKFVESLTGGETIPGEILTPTQLYCVFQGLDKSGDSTVLEEAEKKQESSKKKKKKEDRNDIEIVKVAGSKIDGEEIDIDKWLAGRARFRSEMWDLANLLYGHKGKYHEKAHRILFDAFPKMDNTTLPSDYNQDQLNEWLLEQNEKHNTLIEFPRGFRKSTGCVINIVQWILNAPDTNHLICASTRKLGKTRIQEVRDHFSVSDYNRPTDFQLWFPEFCIPVGTGKSEDYECPMAHLRSPYATVAFTSVESSKAGFRASHIYFDDAQDDKNYKEADQRAAVAETFDLTCELLIRPFGYCTVVGTRYTDGRIDDNPDGRIYDKTDTKIPDLYGEITQRIKRSNDESWEVLIEPAWKVKSEAVDKLFIDYNPEDVDLLMDEGAGLFSVLKKKAIDNESLFRCNQLNEPAAHLGDSTIYVNHYTDGLLTDCQINISHCPIVGKDYILIDYANSVREQADYSVMVAYRVIEPDYGDPVAYLRSVRFGHWTNSQLAENIVSFWKKWPSRVLIEELVTTSSFFKEGIQKEKLRQGTEDFDIHWFKTDNQARAKEVRIKALEVLAVSGRWKICIGEGTEASLWIDELKKQFIGYTGHKTRKNHVGGRHDDIPDACAMLNKVMSMANTTPLDLEFQKKVEEQMARRRQYEHIHGFSTVSSVSHSNLIQEAPPRNPIGDALSPLRSVAREDQISFPRRRMDS